MNYRIIVPALAAIASAAVASAADDVQFHGFASQGFLQTTKNELYGRETTNGTWSFNEFAINAVATPVDRIRVGVQLFSNSLGEFGENKVKIDWAFGEYAAPLGDSTSFTVTGGRFKTGHGLYNDFRDLDMTRTAVFLPESVYAASFRDFFLAVNGASVGLSQELGSLGSVDMLAWVGNQEVDNVDGPIPKTFLTLGFINSVDEITVERLQGGSLTWNTPLDGLRLKGSLLTAQHLVAEMRAKQSSFGPATLNAGTAVTADVTSYFNLLGGAELLVGDWTLAGEYGVAYWKAVTDTTLSVGPVTVPFRQVDYSRMHSAYLSASYRFASAWEASLSGNWMYEEYGASTKQDEANFRRWGAAALRWDVWDHWLIKAEYQLNRGYLGVASADNPQGREEYWSLFALKTTFDF